MFGTTPKCAALRPSSCAWPAAAPGGHVHGTGMAAAPLPGQEEEPRQREGSA